MKKQDRLVFEDMRQKVNLLEKQLGDLSRDLKNQELELTYLRNLVDELRSKKPRGKLQAVQVPEDKAEQVAREKASRERMEKRRDAEGSS